MDATSDEPGQRAGWCAGRRALLCGVGGLTAAGLLAACGDGKTANAAGAGGTPTSAGGAPTSAVGVAGVASLAKTADVPVSGGTVVGTVLIVQPVAGTFKAYDAACPHKGVLLAAPTGGIAKCPAHGSTFSITDGSRLSGPATHGLTEIAVAVHGADIVRS